ncbi:Potassium voltage-gated channel sub KQT member 4 [Blomia tropicalis]|nr:Potassium voltage-gated channel sub KQT member 4 [Blomia tropicalis]
MSENSFPIFQNNNVKRNDYFDFVLHQLKVKIFCGLHNPAGFYRFYHHGFLFLIFLNCFVLNLMTELRLVQNKVFNIITVIDCFLLTVLLLEFLMRFYVANCIQDYSGLSGIFNFIPRKNSISIPHFTLLFTISISSIFKNFISVVYENTKLLVMSLTLYFVVFVIMSYGVYYFELESNAEINSLFDAAWFGFESLATIGYGDVTIHKPVTKVFTAILVLIGFCIYTLPASIIGSAIAMRLQEKRQKILCLRPAANLFQKIWRFYAVTHIPDYWAKYVSIEKANNPKMNRKLQGKEKYTLLFICKLSYLVAQKRFKYANLVHTTGSVPLQYVILQKKTELMNTAIRKHKIDIYKIYKRVKLLAHTMRDCKRLVRANKLRPENKPETKTDFVSESKQL